MSEEKSRLLSGDYPSPFVPRAPQPLVDSQTRAQRQRRYEKQAEVWMVARINELSPLMPKKQAVRQANEEWDKRHSWEVHGPK